MHGMHQGRQGHAAHQLVEIAEGVGPPAPSASGSARSDWCCMGASRSGTRHAQCRAAWAWSNAPIQRREIRLADFLLTNQGLPPHNGDVQLHHMRP